MRKWTYTKLRKNIFKYNLDFLRTVIDHSTKYNNIILNPHFIRLQNLSIEDRDFIKTTYPILKKGNIDIYITPSFSNVWII